jgi:hypothetical protein
MKGKVNPHSLLVFSVILCFQLIYNEHIKEIFCLNIVHSIYIVITQFSSFLKNYLFSFKTRNKKKQKKTDNLVRAG